MTKTELISKIAADADISKISATNVLNSFIETVKEELKKKDGKITLTGFGTFTKIRRKERMCRNPKTGDPIKVEAKDVVKFKPGKLLRNEI